MTLNAAQIAYISNYIQSFNIKWYELQVELTDHFVMIMEEIWSKDPELTFHQVKYYAEQRFGRNYFENVVDERKTILHKEYNRQQRKMVADYLKFPKIIGSVFLGILVYQFSFYFENPHQYIAVLFGLFIVFLIPMIYYWFKNRKISGKRFLAIEVYSTAFTGIPLLALSLANFVKDEIKEYPVLIIPFIGIWVVGFLFGITGIHVYKKLISNIKKQYQLT